MAHNNMNSHNIIWLNQSHFPIIKSEMNVMSNEDVNDASKSVIDKTHVSDSSKSTHEENHDNNAYGMSHLSTPTISPYFSSTSYKLYVCDHFGCNFKSDRVYNMNNHKRRHSIVKEFTCYFPGCEKQFKYKEGLQRHRKEHDIFLNSKFKCHFCDFLAHRKDKLDYHVKSHSNPKSKNFINSVESLNMMKNDYNDNHHEGIENKSQNQSNPIKSTEQKKGIKQEKMRKVINELEDHKISLEPYKFLCDQPGCTYGTYQSSNLSTHKRTHSKDKQFHCINTGCDLSFKHKSSMMRHVKEQHIDINARPTVDDLPNHESFIPHPTDNNNSHHEMKIPISKCASNELIKLISQHNQNENHINGCSIDCDEYILPGSIDDEGEMKIMIKDEGS